MSQHHSLTIGIWIFSFSSHQYSIFIVCCQTPVLGLRLGVDFVFPLSQQQQQEEEEEEEPSPKSTIREGTIGL